MRADSNRIRAYSSGLGSNSLNDPTHSLQHALGSELPIDQQRLADILDEYLEKIEEEQSVDADALLAQHPDLADPLRECLSGLKLLNAGFAEVAPASDLPLPEQRGCLGDYEIIREVGRGGMGVVYEAHQISLDRRVALKVLPFAAMLDQRQIIRFENEARAAARLHHPHIVPVYGVGCDRGVHYFVMQFINGQSFRELVDSCQRLPGRSGSTRSANEDGWTPSPRDVARLGIQAANALEAAHECGVIHRDIKPSNLMLDFHGQLWITDFGLARCQSEKHITQSGDVIGTLHYMSPEQTRGSTVADPRTDIYSLGVTLFEMLTLRRPFEGTTHADVIQQIELGVCKPLRHWNSSVPRDLENVIAKAMAVEPADRYQTAADLEEELRRFADGKVTHAKPPSRAQLLTRWATRNRGLVVSSVAAMCVVCLTLTAATIWLINERAKLAVKHEKANHKLETTETTFERFGLATVERLKHVPGSASARQALLNDLLEHYQTLLHESADTPTLRADRAVTSTKIATVYREAGELARAVDAYRAAESDFELLLEGQPDNRDYAAQLAKCLSSASVVLDELGDIDEARSELRRAIGIQQRLLEKSRDVGIQLDLAKSYSTFGSIENGRRIQTALGHLKHAAGLAEQARAVSSGDELVEALSSLASIYANLSALRHPTSISAAINDGERAVDCTRSLMQAEATTRAEFAALHARHCNNLATLYVQQGQPSKAIGLFKEATSHLERIDDRQTLVVTLCNLAKTQHGVKKPLNAASNYRKAIAVQSALLLESPANLNHLSRLGALHNNLAFEWHSLGKLENACVTYEAAIEHQHRAFKLAPPQITEYREVLSRTFFNAGRASLDAGRPFQAAELHRRRGELWPNDAEQLFSVATNMAVAVGRMPDDDPRRADWRCAAERTLRNALDVDADQMIDTDKATRLSRFLSDASTPIALSYANGRHRP